MRKGRWLIALGADADSTLKTLRTERPSLTIQALISSPAGLDTLAQHLGDALVVQEPGGQTLLQRSYAPHVLLLTEVPQAETGVMRRYSFQFMR